MAIYESVWLRDFRTAWDMLLEQIEGRDQKLDGAGEIHRFNRDVEDISSRIQVQPSIRTSIRDGRSAEIVSIVKKSGKFCNEIFQIKLSVAWFIGIRDVRE